MMTCYFVKYCGLKAKVDKCKKNRCTEQLLGSYVTETLNDFIHWPIGTLTVLTHKMAIFPSKMPFFKL